MAAHRNASSPRGRSGGRSGGSGYDYQDLYVALHLAELLMEIGRDPLREVLWEKKALDTGDATGVEPVHVDDLVLLHNNGVRVYVQLKEHSPRGGWTIRHVIDEGIAGQFFRQWSARPEDERSRTVLRLASGGNVAPLRDVVDVAQRSRTARELRSAEASVATAGDIAVLAKALRLGVDDVDLLAFLQTIDTRPLPDASGLAALIAATLTGFGANAPALVDRLVRLVAESKHAGRGARSSYTRNALIERLTADGMPADDLVSAGVLSAAPLLTPIAWSNHRAAVVEQFERFRLYGLDVATPVYADLAKLFVPPHVVASFRDGNGHMHPEIEMERRMRRREPRFYPRDEREFFHDHHHLGGSMPLSELFANTRRFGFVAGPGTGKTTTLRWLALVSAMGDDEGPGLRTEAGLPPTPLIPLYVSFRQFARRVRGRDLDGVSGRVGLVADFLAVQLESGLLGTPPSRDRALQAAEGLLKSEDTLLLFDGLDEVTDGSMRETLFAAVTDLVQKYEQPRVVIATRPSGIRALRMSTKLPFYELLPLDERQRTTFARRWYAAVRTDGGTLLDPQTADARGASLAEAAESLSDLTANPLLLSILALIHFNRGGGVPVDRATLYDHATSAMLGHWDRDAAGRDLGDDAIPRNWSDVLRLTPDEIRTVMEDIGWRLHVGKQTEVGAAALAEMLADAIGIVSPSGAYAPQERASVMLQLLGERSGLVLEREPHVFAFAHLSFRDYLGARFRVRVDRGDLQPLTDLATDDAHDELLRFAIGVLRLRPDGPQKTRAFLMKIGAIAPMLAASSLLEAPDVELPPATIEALAHGLWRDAERGGANRAITWQALRAVLARATDPDTLLLSLLARCTPSRHGPSELPVRALLARPARPLAPALAWVLTRVAALPIPDHGRMERERGPHDWRVPTQLRAVAGLLLVESGAELTEHVEALAGFLGDRFPGMGGDSRGTPEDRARRMLLAGLAHDTTRKSVQARLRGLAMAEHAEVDQREIVRILVEARVPATAPTVAVLMEGLSRAWEREDAAALLTTWMADDASAATVTRVLERALANDAEAVRRIVSRLLGRVTLPISAANDRSDGEREEEVRLQSIVTLLTDPATADETRATLDEELWDDDASVAWQSAQALAAADRLETPGLAQAFVRVGFASDRRQDIAAEMLRKMLADPRSTRATRAALREGAKHSTGRVAGASALLFIETSGALDAAHVTRHIEAALRDESTFHRALPHIEMLLAGETLDATIGLLVRHIEGNKPDVTIASEVALILAAHGERAHPSVIRALVSYGCARSETCAASLTILRTLLDDRESTSETRRVLVKALESDARDVAWNAARLLCERGSFTAPRLPEVLTAGLAYGGSLEREAARVWIAEILARPRLAKEMRQALERAMSRAIHASQHNRNYELGWEAARCLVAARAYEADYLAETLITAGFGERQRHAEAFTFLATVAAAKAELAADIEEHLLKELQESEDKDVRWGTACAMLDLFLEAVREVASASMWRTERDPHIHDGNEDEKVKAARATLAGLLRALLNEEKESVAARQRLDTLLAWDLAPAIRDGFAFLLPRRGDDDDRTTAFLAAEYVLARDGYSMKAIASALVEGGLRDDDLRPRAMAALDALWSDPITEGIAADALGAALWSADAVVGAASTAYLASRGDTRSPGVIRGFVRAITGRQRRGWNPEIHVETRLRDSETRSSTLGALSAVVFDDGDELPYAAARLLVMSGGAPTPRVLDVLDQAAENGNVLGPLALLSLTGRVDAVRATAGSRRTALLAVIGELA